MESLKSMTTKCIMTYQTVLLYLILTSYSAASPMWIWTEGCVKDFSSSNTNMTLTNNLPSTCFKSCGRESLYIALQGNVCLCNAQQPKHNSFTILCRTTCEHNDQLECGDIKERHWSLYRRASHEELANQGIQRDAPGCVIYQHQDHSFRVHNCSGTQKLHSLCRNTLGGIKDEQICSEVPDRWSSNACKNGFDRLITNFSVLTDTSKCPLSWIGLFAFEEESYKDSTSISLEEVTISPTNALNSLTTDMILFSEYEYTHRLTPDMTIINTPSSEIHPSNILMLSTIALLSSIFTTSSVPVASEMKYSQNNLQSMSSQLHSSFRSLPQSLKSSEIQEIYLTSVPQPLKSSKLHSSFTSEPQPLKSSEIQESYFTSVPQPLKSSKVHSSFTSEPMPLKSSKLHSSFTSDPKPLKSSQVQENSSTSVFKPSKSNQLHSYFTSVPQPLKSSKVHSSFTSALKPLKSSQLHSSSTSTPTMHVDHFTSILTTPLSSIPILSHPLTYTKPSHPSSATIKAQSTEEMTEETSSMSQSVSTTSKYKVTSASLSAAVHSTNSFYTSVRYDMSSKTNKHFKESTTTAKTIAAAATTTTTTTTTATTTTPLSNTTVAMPTRNIAEVANGAEKLKSALKSKSDLLIGVSVTGAIAFVALVTVAMLAAYIKRLSKKRNTTIFSGDDASHPETDVLSGSSFLDIRGDSTNRGHNNAAEDIRSVHNGLVVCRQTGNMRSDRSDPGSRGQADNTLSDTVSRGQADETSVDRGDSVSSRQVNETHTDLTDTVSGHSDDTNSTSCEQTDMTSRYSNTLDSSMFGRATRANLNANYDRPSLLLYRRSPVENEYVLY